MLKIRIESNPYVARVDIKVFNDANPTGYLPPNSELEKYDGKDCVFAFCAEDIIGIIEKFYNNSEYIEFIGTTDDYDVLKNLINISSINRIPLRYIKKYESAPHAIKIIKEAYRNIHDEFSDCPNHDIVTTINKFEETVSTKIPLCVIGNYSTGKSTFINALIGYEVLPTSFDPCTAINVEVVNSPNEYIVKINYSGRLTSIDFKKCEISPYSMELEKCLQSNGFNYSTEPERIWHFFEYLNGKESKEFFGETARMVELRLPFKNSNLNTENDICYSICDTPGSNNDENREHFECLMNVLRDQTNALPIFVVDKHTQASTDNNTLLTLLADHKEEFSTPYTLIVMNKADTLVGGEIKRSISEIFINQFMTPRVYYVSSLQCVAAKKENGGIDVSEWMSQTPWEIYNENIRGKHKNLHLYNNSTKDYAEYPLELIESGMLDVEDAVNEFAEKFAYYKKCENGVKYLLDAITGIKALINEKKEELKNKRAESERKRDYERKKIQTAIESVKLPSASLVFSKIRSDYTQRVKEYTDQVEKKLTYYLTVYEGNKDLKDNISERMKQDCQLELYDKYYHIVRSDIENLFNRELEKYKGEVYYIIYSNKDKLSPDAENELENIAITTAIPAFTKKRSTFLGVSFLAGIGSLKIKAIREKWIENTANKFIKYVSGDDKKTIGAFYKDCINVPCMQYSKDLNVWRETYLHRINSTLVQENSVLSGLEEEIKNLNAEIHDLEIRLSNIQDAERTLKTVLGAKEVNS